MKHERITNVDLHFPSFMSLDARDLISKLLVHQPSMRLSLTKVMEHPWVIRNTKGTAAASQEKENLNNSL